MRANNEPHFAFKSLSIVFSLQGIIAWLVSLPLLAAIVSHTPINLLDYLGVTVWFVGMIFETGADWQLARFKANPTNQGKVLDTGLWRYTRHPNYFGNACIWAGLFVIGLAAGGWWSILSPVMMTFLLRKVSGVALIEKDMPQRRPAYGDYIRQTNAFFPGPPKTLLFS
jgi:steroid 5-alpha reductase family enzyme